jgi:hypothetical protein
MNPHRTTTEDIEDVEETLDPDLLVLQVLCGGDLS